MPKLFHLDSSPAGDRSVSRALTAEFVKSWQAANPGGTVVNRDLTTTALKPVDGAWIGAAYTAPDARSEEQKAVLALSDELIAELKDADEWVLGVPMYNFSVPGTFKLWIDQISRVGVTFAYVDGAPKGLITGKKATFIVASGGDYGPGTATESYNFVEPYLKTIFGFLGVTEPTFQNVGGTMALNYGADRDTFLAPQVEKIRAKFAK